MCKLLGVSSAKRVRVNELLQEFYSHSDKHPHGWGLATFYHGSASVEKEPTQALKSVYLKERLSHKMDVSTLLAHIRLATVGNIEYGNSHPFVKRDATGRAWTLVHNGTIFDYPALEPYRCRQEGDTDSERILLYLVDRVDQKLAEAGRDLSAKERFELLNTLVADMAQGNKLNLLIYDGEWMYVHSNYANSLYVCENGETAIFSTAPMKQGDWKPMPFTALCAYQKGRCVLRGQSHGNEYVPSKKDLQYLSFALSNREGQTEYS